MLVSYGWRISYDLEERSIIEVKLFISVFIVIVERICDLEGYKIVFSILVKLSNIKYRKVMLDLKKWRD